LYGGGQTATKQNIFLARVLGRFALNLNTIVFLRTLPVGGSAVILLGFVNKIVGLLDVVCDSL